MSQTEGYHYCLMLLYRLQPHLLNSETLHTSTHTRLTLPPFPSTMRQVPDHQEVYLEADGFASLSIDLTERQTQFTSDKEALQYHLNDIVAEGDTAQIASVSENIQLPKFP